MLRAIDLLVWIADAGFPATASLCPEMTEALATRKGDQPRKYDAATIDMHHQAFRSNDGGRK